MVSANTVSASMVSAAPIAPQVEALGRGAQAVNHRAVEGRLLRQRAPAGPLERAGAEEDGAGSHLLQLALVIKVYIKLELTTK